MKQFIIANDIKRIDWIHNPNFNKRIKYYSNALALVHPSLSEGFGLPLIEAMHFNLPIIASNIPVFNEILGNSYLSFNPINPKSIADKLNEFLHASENLPSWIKAYQNNLKQYSFKQMAKQTYDVYKKILNE